MQKQALNQGWRFHLEEKDSSDWGYRPDYASWPMLDLPHDWSIGLERGPDNPSGISNGWFTMGRGTYQKAIEAPEAWRGKKVLVEFEGVYMNAEVSLNEHFLRRHPYGYTSFTCDLTPYLRIGEQNTLTVNVNNSGQLNSRWYSGSGIYRPAWLYVCDPLHIAHWGIGVTTPIISETNAVVQASVLVENETQETRAVTLRSRIFAPDGALVGQAESSLEIPAGGKLTITQDFEINKPQLWSPDIPYLYQLETELVSNGGGSSSDQSDSATVSFGIRSLAWSAEQGLLLNGQSIKMKGGCVHHDNGVMGAASFPRSEERKVELLKASGYNAIRCAHNPPAPAFLDACDRLGMLVIDETFDCWRVGKNPFDYHCVFEDWWERDTESMVLRDRNHPSVVIWSIGNEVYERDGRSDGERIARMQAEKVRSLDPTRPITSAINGIWDPENGRTWENTAPVYAVLDIGGYNYQWSKYLSDHEKYPQRIMMGTESFPLEALDNWQMVLDHPYIIGDFVWTSWDYLGESGIGRQHYNTERPHGLGDYPWHQAYCGDIDLAGFKRPQSYYRDTIWGMKEQLYIAVHYPVPEGKTPVITQWGWPDVDANWTWPGREGQAFQVDVYTACEQVELLLNGRSLGVKPAEKHIASFEAPYEPGELKAVGITAGAPVAQAALQTTGAPAGIRLTPDRDAIHAEAGDLSFITVEVVDENGCMHPGAGNTIFFTTQGAGEIAAVGSGNPTSTERYTGNQRKAYRGRCVVVVKSNGQPGEIRLRAQADGLVAAETIIRAE